MKIVVNTAYGGFTLPEELETPLSNKGYNLDSWFKNDRNLRKEDILVEWVEKNADDFGYAKVNGGCTLHVIHIPDQATDWMLDEDYGAEYVIYVVNGKLYLKWDSVLLEEEGGPANEKINKED